MHNVTVRDLRPGDLILTMFYDGGYKPDQCALVISIETDSNSRMLNNTKLTLLFTHVGNVIYYYRSLDSSVTLLSRGWLCHTARG